MRLCAVVELPPWNESSGDRLRVAGDHHVRAPERRVHVDVLEWTADAGELLVVQVEDGSLALGALVEGFHGAHASFDLALGGRAAPRLTVTSSAASASSTSWAAASAWAASKPRSSTTSRTAAA